MSAEMTRSEAFRVQRWLGFEFEVPADWEIVRHGSAHARGRLVFVDRRRQRLELCWTHCEKVPDLERLVSEYRSRAEETLERASRHEFDVLLGSGKDGQRLVRAVRFDPSSSRLVELTLFGDATVDASCCDRVLSSFTCPAPGGRCRFTAFNLDLCLPDRLELERADVRPADVTLVFQPRGGKSDPARLPRASVRRRAMARSWFNGDLSALLRAESKRARLSIEPSEHRGHPAAAGLGRPRGAVIPALFGRARAERAIAWLCPEHDAVFSVTTLSTSRQPLALEDVSVRCCGGEP